MIFNTLKFRGSFFIFSLSMIQTRITKMTKYESCDNSRCSTYFLFSVLLSSFCKAFSPPSMGKNEVWGGRYLQNKLTQPPLKQFVFTYSIEIHPSNWWNISRKTQISALQWIQQLACIIGNIAKLIIDFFRSYLVPSKWMNVKKKKKR